jgi:hypothetical protein
MSRANGPRRKRRRSLFAPIALIIVGLFWLGAARALRPDRGHRGAQPQRSQARRVRAQRVRARSVVAPEAIPWIANAANGHAYAAIDGGTWAACESAAARLGGHLVTINDPAEQAWLLERFGPSNRCWIGLTDAGSEGQWRWVTGEPLDYTNWAPEEPNDYGTGSEDYAHMGPKQGGTWNDLGPDSDQWAGLTKAIIERPARPAGVEWAPQEVLPSPLLGEFQLHSRSLDGREARRRVLYIEGQTRSRRQCQSRNRRPALRSHTHACPSALEATVPRRVACGAQGDNPQRRQKPDIRA